MVLTRNPREKGLLTRKAQSGLKTAVAALKGTSRKHNGAQKSAPSSDKGKESKKDLTSAGASTETKVRVWWPPTKAKSRTDFSGMYWPARILEKTSKGFRVQYDNGDKENVDEDQVSPFSLPVEFGKEESPLHVGEFVEVFNNSKTDPAAWVAVIKKIQGDSFVVTYPFHDAGDEKVKGTLLRRARVYDHRSKNWNYVIPSQTWKDGEVTSPVELEIFETESELFDRLGMTKLTGGVCHFGGVNSKLRFERQTLKPAVPTPRRGGRVKLGPKEEPVVEETGATTRRGKRVADSAQEAATPKLGAGAAKEAPIHEVEAEAPASPASKRRGGRRGAGSSGAEEPSAIVQSATPAGPPEAAPLSGGEPNMAMVMPGADPLASLSQDQVSVPTTVSLLPSVSLPPQMALDVDAAGINVSAEVRRRRRKKDPRAPKKSLTSYLVFMQRHRAELAAANPGVSTQDLTTLLAEKWKTVEEEERKLCEEIALNDHVRWSNEMKVYEASPPPPLPLPSDGEKKRKRRAKSPTAPKKPRTAYILFTMEHRKTMPGADFNDATSETARAWQALTMPQREIYIQQAQREREAYRAANKVYQERKQLQQQDQFVGTSCGGVSHHNFQNQSAAFMLGAAVPLPLPADLPPVTGAVDTSAQQLELMANFTRFLSQFQPALLPGTLAVASIGAPASFPAAVQALAPATQALSLPNLTPPTLPAIGIPAAVPLAPGPPADPLVDFQEIKCKKGMQKAGFVEDAWHMLLDACRPQSLLYPQAVKAHEQYMRGRTKNIDYRAIMISIFGLEAVKPLQTGPVTPTANGQASQ